MKPIKLLAYVGGLGPFCRDMKGVHYDGSIRIVDLQDLASKLENEVKPHKSFCDNWFFDCSPIEAGQISKLGILAYGDVAGVVHIDGKRTGETCVEVFRVKDTNVKGNLGDSFFRKRYEEYPVQVPSSPHAKWARDGKIIRWPCEEQPECLRKRSHGAPRINCPSKERTIIHQPSEL